MTFDSNNFPRPDAQGRVTEQNCTMCGRAFRLTMVQPHGGDVMASAAGGAGTRE